MNFRAWSAVSMLILSSGLQADTSGAAVVPHWGSFFSAPSTNTKGNTHLYVSNISHTAITVSISLFDWEGDSPGDAGFNPVINAKGALQNCNALNTQCELAPNTTGFFNIGNDGSTTFPSVHGYGKIEWTSTGSQSVSLVAHGLEIYEVLDKSGTSHLMKGNSAITINNGLPF